MKRSLYDRLTLSEGQHLHRSLRTVCAMEAAAWLAGEPHSDHPQCVSPVIAAFLRRWNDDLPDDATRDRLLKPLLPVVLNTVASQAVEGVRSIAMVDWMVRDYTPAWLDLGGKACASSAAGLRELASPVVCVDAEATTAWLVEATRRLQIAQNVASAAWAAAWAAARATAGAAVWAAAWAATRAAAGDAAWDALTPIVATVQASACDLVRRLAAMSDDVAPQAAL